MSHYNVLSVILYMSNSIYKVVLNNIDMEKGFSPKYDVGDVNDSCINVADKLYSAFSLFQYRLSGIFA